MWDAGQAGGLSQQLPDTVGTYKFWGCTSLVMRFDARYDGEGIDADGRDYLRAYFAVDGVRDVAGTWETRFDGTAAQKVHRWARLPGGDPRPGYGTATTDAPARNKAGTVGPQNMETFSVTLDLSKYADHSTISIVFMNQRFQDGGAPSLSNRVYMDNVRVNTVGDVEPTGAVLLVK